MDSGAYQECPKCCEMPWECKCLSVKVDASTVDVGPDAEFEKEPETFNLKSMSGAILRSYMKPNPFATQVSGDHYKRFKIQPVEFIHANGIPYMEGNVIKYICRHKDKNGLADLEKAKHYIELLIELEYKDEQELADEQ